jgi:hypothetical protein
MDTFDNKAYQKKYYENVLREKMKNTIVHCDVCNLDFAGWNFYKHKQSKKHVMNCMTCDERNEYLKQKQQDKEKRKIERKLNKLQNIYESMI